LVVATSVVAALGAGGNAAAHHSQVLFDMNKCLTLSGTVRTWQFESPHSWLWVVVPNAKGSTDVGLPRRLARADDRGRAPLKRDIVKAGDKVTLEYSPLKTVGPAGLSARSRCPTDLARGDAGGAQPIRPTRPAGRLVARGAKYRNLNA
jgi:hypothetical protein